MRATKVHQARQATKRKVRRAGAEERREYSTFMVRASRLARRMPWPERRPDLVSVVLRAGQRLDAQGTDPLAARKPGDFVRERRRPSGFTTDLEQVEDGASSSGPIPTTRSA